MEYNVLDAIAIEAITSLKKSTPRQDIRVVQSCESRSDVAIWRVMQLLDVPE